MSPAMTTMAPPRPTVGADNFDMTKLQKSLKQRQRLSVRNSPHVAKLTAAEIRSLNHSALASQAGSEPSSKAASPSRSRRSTTATPPASPDHSSAREGRRPEGHLSRESSFNVPSTPVTPSERRGSSRSSAHGRTPAVGEHDATLQSPRPRGSAQAAFMVANGMSSRPSSSRSSSYRGLATYRGHEVTRTGSMNMLQRPPADIVANPLSYFSRPRQSMVGTSPERRRHGSQDSGIDRPRSERSARTASLASTTTTPSRPVSPPKVTDSPTSIHVNDTYKFPVVDVEDPHNQPKIQSDEEGHRTERNDKTNHEERQDRRAQPDVEQTQSHQKESPKKESKKRFTIIGGALFGKEKNSVDGSDSINKLKKNRRRTMSCPEEGGAKKPTTEGPSQGPVEQSKPDTEGTADDDFATHPTVRPLSLIIPGEFKGKEKEIDAGPVYARCSCCGKLKRPPGYSSELSPVLENENLRTNFSFEIERTSPTAQRRSSDASRDKFKPIIPMQISESEARQATVEPYKGAASPVRPPSPADIPTPRRSKKHATPPKFVRFGSLHGRRTSDPTVINEEDEIEDQCETSLIEDEERTPKAREMEHHYNTPLVVQAVPANRPVVEYGGQRTSIEAQLSTGTSPLITGNATFAAPSLPAARPESTSATTTNLHSQPSEEEAERTPLLEPEHVQEQEAIRRTPTYPEEQLRPLLSLPEPSFGPQFIRSNTIVRMSMGLDMQDVGVVDANNPHTAADARSRSLKPERLQNGQKWMAEVMAV
ncbi:hypothetical protein HRR81_001497 [Exophiala dermatitidis]|uniref:Uncharacterized protein n=1 Tax=Exophiala dermatitidis TaxID=5970 RepID=A0AAN6F1N1_EXODE|nr:hypothetical protein HRR75_002424 [Exophiala dermatitidis]KAJ4522066.1 hypothetical protein HRR74_002645 [Exophiala dermatitidis]KAJ4529392.1 hypothetical protein HRR73_000415 [Exophiala dermatitidis]KAJ4549127.1 hypothetical protein HRR77_004005 [Exophiala dermatitidis]KAJ4557599.1 hypothetical protein HRR78_001271 [Exophiala dermatitidis]